MIQHKKKGTRWVYNPFGLGPRYGCKLNSGMAALDRIVPREVAVLQQRVVVAADTIQPLQPNKKNSPILKRAERGTRKEELHRTHPTVYCILEGDSTSPGAWCSDICAHPDRYRTTNQHYRTHHSPTRLMNSIMEYLVHQHPKKCPRSTIGHNSVTAFWHRSEESRLTVKRRPTHNTSRQTRPSPSVGRNCYSNTDNQVDGWKHIIVCSLSCLFRRVVDHDIDAQDSVKAPVQVLQVRRGEA